MSAPKPGSVKAQAGDGEDFAQQAAQFAQDAQRLAGDAKDAAEGLLEAVDLPGRVKKNPYGMVATAFGIGYVLGGGLFSRTTSRALGLAARLAAVPAVRDQLIEAAEAVLDGVLEQTRPIATGKPKKAAPRTRHDKEK
jgi:cell division septum initiation protein DivIVA